MVKHSLVYSSSCSTCHVFFRYWNNVREFQYILGNVNVSIHLFINDCIGLHKYSAPSLISLAGIISHPALFRTFIERKAFKTVVVVT